MSAEVAESRAEAAGGKTSSGYNEGHSTSIDELRSDNALWYKLHVFMYDLRNFRSNSDSRTRLDSVVHEYYLGEPYFSEDEANKVLHTVPDAATEKTVGEAIRAFYEQKLLQRQKSRAIETGDYRICAAHDLAPIFEKAFRLNGKDLAKNKGFMALVNKGGLNALEDGRVWKGLGKR